MRQVANFPTFVWLDSIDAVNGTNGYPRSLAGHLDAALAQGANAIRIVVYDLPNRDCSALASNGELLIAQNGFNRYKAEYIDVIYNTISQAKYSNLRIVAVIEPDSLPNLITNLSFPKCSEAQSTGVYVQGVQYVISRIRSLNNTYAYIDVAHHAWLGWDSNFNPFVTLLKQVGAGIGARPTAAPAARFDAYVWVKPPGESDGSSSLIPTGPENPGGKGFDRMCDPTYTGNQLNGNNMTGALPNAPVSGRWFQAQFVQLVQKAFPPFQ